MSFIQDCVMGNVLCMTMRKREHLKYVAKCI